MNQQRQQQHRREATATGPSPTALALRSQAESIIGSASNPAEATKRLREALDKMILISPSTSVGTLPLGCEVMFSTVFVDKSETYSTGSGANAKFGLSKVALDRIASAAGISWDARRSGRTDDGSDPRYCAWRAVGTVRNFDGTEREIIGNKEMDLREGSSTIAALRTRYDAALARWNRDKRGERPKDPSAQINEQRLHIMAHAETKARLRAIRSIGLEGGYSLQDLEKPFVVARLAFTGRVPGDPELERLFALKQADAMLGGTKLLYGGAPEPIVTAQPARLPAPPPVGTTRADDDDVIEGEFVDAIKAPAKPKAAPAQEPAKADASTPTPAPTEKQSAPAEREPSGFTIPGGREKGTPIEDASDDSLEWWHRKISQNLEDGSTDDRYRAKDEKLVAALAAEMEWRSGERDPFDEDEDDGSRFDDDVDEDDLPEGYGR